MSIFTHPLREGVMQVLNKHFAPEIVKKFQLVFEAETFQGQNIMNQIQNDRVALEVYFEADKGTEFICDVWSDMNRKQVEYRLLRYITDAARVGKIGNNWIEGKDRRISEDVSSGKFETRGEVSDN